jgi:hypothetical protein
MINARTGAGAHSSLLINASQRVMFDPAGSFFHETVPEQNDLLYGITPEVEQFYRGSHARSTHYVVIQKIEVSPAQAETAFRLAQKAGPVAGAFCTNATTGLLQQVPGFESIQSTFYPNKLMEQFAQWPGVSTERYSESDDPDLQAALAKGF